MKVYGSLMNRLQENKQAVEPEKGVGVTFYSWSDRHAGTIQRVWTEGRNSFIAVTEDEAKRTDKNGMSESQDYEYTERPDGYEYIYRRVTDSDEPWRSVRKVAGGRRWKLYDHRAISIGWRDAYHDFSF